MTFLCVAVRHFVERFVAIVPICRTILIVFITAILVAPIESAEEPPVLPVWPGTVPADYGNIGPERVRTPAESPTKDAKWITGVTKPTITLFRPTSERNTGTAILICPGGGYWN